MRATSDPSGPVPVSDLDDLEWSHDPAKDHDVWREWEGFGDNPDLLWEIHLLVDAFNDVVDAVRESGGRFLMERDSDSGRVTSAVVVGADGQRRSIRWHETLSLREAAKCVGLTRSALYARVHDAERAGVKTPFWHTVSEGGAIRLRVRREELMQWAKSWTGLTGRRARRSSP